jgi:Flp pilus assembly protein TadG
MASKIETNNAQGVLARLLKDQSGNVLAMMAASVLPIIGIVGGAVDMGRMYAVKTRLQAACDAGVVAGRKVMAGGDWDGNTAAQTAANSMFNLNFANGLYGSKNLTKTFDEILDDSNQPIEGALGGTASADVPQTLMRVFGRFNETITVKCTSEMKIPHTDVMFVLDITGSMADPIPGDTTGLTKINGIKRATKCFYESLAREDIDDVTKEQCFKTSDPSGGLSTLTQLRFGFVPYHQVVNVGRLLPNDMMADQALYQSRTPNTQTVYAWGLGTATPITGFGAWSPAATPSSLNSRSGYSGWTTMALSPTTVSTPQGTKSIQITTATSANCGNNNNYTSPAGTNQLTALQETAGIISQTLTAGPTNSTPTYPAASQVSTYSNSQTNTVTGYSYAWVTVPTGKKTSITGCFLQSAAMTYTKTQSGGTSTVPINWTPYQKVVNWTYQPVMVNIAGFKGGFDGQGKPVYNPTITLPLNETNGPSVKLSGSTSLSTFKVLANKTIKWQPCIEEIATHRNTDGNPSDEWNPIPAAAKDMVIDHVPNIGDDATRWRPTLNDVVWDRGSSLGPITDVATRSIGYDFNCPATTTTSTAEARKLQAYRESAGANNYRDYINALATAGNTYHDIGLLWGARLMSPDGIFGAENKTTPAGADITRHMVFMTDGDTYNEGKNYTAYGIDRWDRRQTNNSTDLGSGRSTLLESVNNSRQTALCNAIKAKQISLWVVFYGTPAGDSYTRLKACASSDKHFFVATDTKLLIETFNKIAASISELKLTV